MVRPRVSQYTEAFEVARTDIGGYLDVGERASRSGDKDTVMG
jgi:hypothetical protein